MSQAYDRSAVNRPIECGEASILELMNETMRNPLTRVRTLHTHFNQVGARSVSSCNVEHLWFQAANTRSHRDVCFLPRSIYRTALATTQYFMHCCHYGIWTQKQAVRAAIQLITVPNVWHLPEGTATLPVVMDAATAIAPGSHKRDKVEFINAYREEHQQEMQVETDPARYLRPFSECGLTVGPVVAKAGELVLFDTAMFHGYCPPMAPYIGSAPVGSGGLLRCACIMSMAPRLLLSPSIIKARQLYFELDIGTGGSVMGRNTEETAQKILTDYAAAEADGTAQPKRRRFVDASSEVQKIIGNRLDFEGAPPESRSCASQPSSRL